MLRLSPNATGALFALMGFAIFSAHDALIKSLAGRYSTLQISFMIAIFTFPQVIVLLLSDRAPGTLIPKNPLLLSIRGLTGTLGAVFAFYTFSVLPLAEAYVLLFATPLLITLLAVPVLGEKLGIRRLCAVIVGLLGVMIVLRPGTSSMSWGHASAMAGSLMGACTALITRKIGRQERPVVILTFVALVNFMLMGSLMPLVYVPMAGLDMAVIAVVALLSGTGIQMQIQAYRRAEAVVVAPMQYSQMIWAVIFGWCFFNESVDALTLLGAAIVAGSGIYIVLREARLKAIAEATSES